MKLLSIYDDHHTKIKVISAEKDRSMVEIAEAIFNDFLGKDKEEQDKILYEAFLKSKGS